MSQYTKIESNLKDLFQSKDVFQFKFDNIAEVVPNNSILIIYFTILSLSL